MTRSVYSLLITAMPKASDRRAADAAESLSGTRTRRVRGRHWHIRAASLLKNDLTNNIQP